MRIDVSDSEYLKIEGVLKGGVRKGGVLKGVNLSYSTNVFAEQRYFQLPLWRLVRFVTPSVAFRSDS